MSIADQKRQENIAEYILFIWQMEDLARAVNFDATSIAKIQGMEDDKQLAEEVGWLDGLCKTMKRDKVTESGHIEEIRELLKELLYLHNTLLAVIKDEKYQNLQGDSYPILREFLVKTKGSVVNEVDAYLTALYGWLILRLKGEQVGEGTQDAMKKFSATMAYLSAEFKKMKAGEMNIGLN